MAHVLNQFSEFESTFGDGIDGALGGWSVTVDSVYVEDVGNQFISTPNHPDFVLTGSQTWVVKTLFDSWNPVGDQSLIGRWDTSGGDNKALRFYIDNGGDLHVRISTDGTTNDVDVQSSVVPPFTAGVPAWLACAFDVDDQVVRFWFSADGVMWQQVGTDRPAAIASVYGADTPVEIGTVNLGAGAQAYASFYYGAVYDGAGFTATGPKGIKKGEWKAEWHTGLTALDFQGHLWTISGTAPELPSVRLLKGVGPYPAYTPDGDTYKNALQITATGTANIVVRSPWATGNTNTMYRTSVALAGDVGDDELDMSVDLFVRDVSESDGESKTTSAPFAGLAGSGTSYIYSENKPLYNLTGDLVLAVHVAPETWTGSEQPLIGKWGEAGEYSYLLSLDSNSFPHLKVSTNGTTIYESVGTTAASSLAPDGNDYWLAAAIDVDNGSSQRVCQFWSSRDGVTWTLDSTDTDSPAIASINTSSTDLEIGRAGGITGDSLRGNVYSAHVYSGKDFTTAGAGGTAVSSWAARTHTYSNTTDDQGNVWILSDYALGDLLLPVRNYSLDEDYVGWMTGTFISKPNTSFVRTKYTFTNVAVDDIYVLYDPVIFDDNLELMSDFIANTYNLLPSFMRTDDESISNLVNTDQPSYPLFRYAGVIGFALGEIADLVTSFDYVREFDSLDGVESKSALTDPLTADPSYFAWLAGITGATLVSNATGATPWIALEEYDPVSSPSPGQWDDLHQLESWLALQNLDPDFFDALTGFRQQILTGFTGINSGRPDATVAYIRTVLETDTSETAVVSYGDSDRDNFFMVKLLVDPGVDPDDAGNLLAEVAAYGSGAGVVVRKISNVLESGEGHLDIDQALYPATHSSTSAGGADTYGPAFVNDADGYGRHLLLNNAGNVAELGGGIGDAHLENGTALYYGANGSSVTTASAPPLDFGGLAGGYDMIFDLTDIEFPTAALDTAGDGGNTPPDWLYRTKRLIAKGLDSASDNDWAVYLVSGATPGVDNDTRIMLVDGYNSSPPNYVASDPLDLNVILEGSQVVLRVRRVGTTVTFYAQQRLNDDWDSNVISTHTGFTANSSSGSSPYMQVLGTMNQGGAWVDADPLSCTVRRVMLFNEPITFDSSDTTSSQDHAIVNGASVDDYGYYIYEPTVDVDMRDLSPHDETFTVPFGNGTTTSASVNFDTPNDHLIYAMRPLGGSSDAFFFSTTTNGASAGDYLRATGLANNTTYYVRPTIITDVGTGTTAASFEHQVTTDSSGNLDIYHSTYYEGVAETYAGKSLTQIEVWTGAGSGAPRVAYFLPGTASASAGASAGADADGTTWNIVRTFPGSNTVGYVPSQYIDRELIHPYKGSPYLGNSFELEVYHPFSIGMSIRRHWMAATGTEYEILNLANGSGDGLRVFYDGPDIKATFTSGSDVETVAWDESAAHGWWHNVVVRRSAVDGLSIVVDADFNTESTTPAAAVDTFIDAPSTFTFSEGTPSQYAGRFGMSHFTFFERYLTDEEITLLHSQIS